MLSISHSDTKANQKSDVILPHISQDGHLKTPTSMSLALAGRVFNTSTTWEALFQYKKKPMTTIVLLFCKVTGIRLPHAASAESAAPYARELSTAFVRFSNPNSHQDELKG